MSDLISRQDAIDAVMAESRKVYTSEYANAERIIYEADAVEALAMLPSADAVHGEWIMHIDDLFPEESTQECSNCHEHETIKIRSDNFCPNCGADMRGDEK